MSSVKYEEKIFFPGGHVYVLLDEDWCVDVRAEDGIGGDFVEIKTWDFDTRKAWLKWGEIVTMKIRKIQDMFSLGDITEDRAFELIDKLEEDFMPGWIQEGLIEE